MKKITFLVAGLIFSLGLSAQTLIFSDDFDSDTANGYVAQQDTLGIWTTWDNAPGSGTDAIVSDAHAYNGANSAHIQNDNDLVLLMGDKTTGRYQLTFEMYIDSGAMGYFNLLQDFAGGNSKWGFQITFHPTGVTKVDAGGDSITGFNYNFDQWYHVNFIIDVDDDFATMYFDSTEIVSWKWSGGSFGDGTTHKLDAADFYGLHDDANSGMYIDNVIFNQMPVLEAPVNLAVNYDGSDNNLTWTAPSTAPDFYLITDNGNVLIQGVTDTAYTDVNPYPQNHVYNVRAQYDGLGYSHSSNDASAMVPGGVNRNWVVFEVGTGTWCPACPGAAMACEDMETKGDSAACIEYHANDNYSTTGGNGRLNHYDIHIFPTGIADGDLKIVGGNNNTSLYPSYHQMYLQRKVRNALFTMDLTATQTGTYDYSVQIDMKQTSDYYPGAKKLYAVVTESNIPKSWQGQSKLDFVARLVLPNANGTSLDFSSQTTQTQTVNFSLDTSWVKDNCKLVVFLQDAGSDEIVQAAKIDLKDVIAVAVENPINLAIYPNPAKDNLYIRSSQPADYSIINLLGQTLQSGHLTRMMNNLDVSELHAGVYFITVTNGNDIQKVKFVKE